MLEIAEIRLLEWSDDDAHKFDAVLLVQFLFTMPFGGDSNEARTCVG